MIVDLCDVVEMKISETFSQLEVSFFDQVEEEIVDFHKKLWSRSLPI